MRRFGWMAAVVLVSLPAVAAEPTYCDEAPVPAARSVSVGLASRGKLLGAKELVPDANVQILPRRHARRCLNWSTGRLIRALELAGQRVREAFPGSAPLMVGDLSRAVGGPIPAYSHSHQSGRDSDLAFFATDAEGRPVEPDDLVRYDARGTARAGTLHFDVKRNWLLVRALLEDPEIDVQWLFISRPLKHALLQEAEREGTPHPLLTRAEQVLHQPSDAPPHDDHLHLRIRCTAEERAAGCRDGG